MKRLLSIMALLVVGAAIGSFITFAKYPLLSGYLKPQNAVQESAPLTVKKKPLYWVAPMDPNYRRDKPGKSPMGMDLIPFYGEEGGANDGPGTVKISPDVVNNLGVRTATVQRGFLHSQIQTVGYVKYDEDQLVHIHPRVSGWIEHLYVKASGDPVKKGEPLYSLYSPELVNAQEELLIALERDKSQLIKAAVNRLTSLRVSSWAISQIKKNREVQQNITFYAPQDGVIANLDIRQGFYVKPGSTIMSIGAIDQVWVEAEVFERQASEVVVGLPVTMTLDYLPGKEWLGEVNYVYPTLNTKTRTLRVRLRFDNEKEMLKPGMFAQVVINLENSKKTLLVPKEAVIRTGLSNRVVLALGRGRFKSVNVKVGRFDQQSAEILSGLSEGERVVTSAQFLIDSESSKTSDFKRMNHSEKVLPASVWTEATINRVMPGQRMINASHKEISAWDWPAMTMDFTVAKDVDIASLKAGMKLYLEITKSGEDKYQITNVHLPGTEDQNQSLDDLNTEGMSRDDMSLDNKKPNDHNQ
jgi:membrane fusion protein, copper/silver efflux system